LFLRNERGPPVERPDPGHQDKAAASALEIERYTIAQIPEDERHGRPRDLFTIWFTSNLIPLAIVTGALTTVAFGLARALNGADLSWLVGLVITVPLYYFSASRRVKAEIAPPVAATTG
jgi:purine-cytosine permease-like protein